jgi:hypothetical protein
MSLTKLSLAGNNLIIPAHGESLVSDIQAGGGKIDNVFYSVSRIGKEKIKNRKIV